MSIRSQSLFVLFVVYHLSQLSPPGPDCLIALIIQTPFPISFMLPLYEHRAFVTFARPLDNVITKFSEKCSAIYNRAVYDFALLFGRLKDGRNFETFERFRSADNSFSSLQQGLINIMLSIVSPLPYFSLSVIGYWAMFAYIARATAVA